MAQANDPFGLSASGIPPEMQAEYRGLTRQQAIAEAMLKHSMEPGGEAINAGKYLVRRSPFEGFAKVLNAYAGQKKLGEIDTKMAGLGSRYQSKVADAMGQYNADKQPKTTTRAPDPFEYDQMGEETPEPTPSTRTEPGNPRQAIVNLLTRQPWMANNPLVKMDIQQMGKAPTHVNLGGEQLLINPDGTQTRIPTSETPEGKANRDLKERIAQQKIDSMTPYQRENLRLQAQRLGISERTLILRDAELGLKLFDHNDKTGSALTRPQLTPTAPVTVAPTAPSAIQPQQQPPQAPQAGQPNWNAETANYRAQQPGRNTEQIAILQRDLANPQYADAQSQATIKAEIAKLSTGAPFAVAGGDPLRPATAPTTAPVGDEIPSFADVKGGVGQLSQPAASQSPKSLDQRIADATAGVTSGVERRAIERRIRLADSEISVADAKGENSGAPVAVVTKDGRGVELVSRKDAIGRTPANIDPETQARLLGAREAAKVGGKAQGTAQVGLPKMQDAAQRMITHIDELKAHSGKPYAVGVGSIAQTFRIPGTPGADFVARLNEINGGAFMEAYNTLKGGGSITDIEGKKATAAITRMSQAQSIGEFDKAADEFKAVIQESLQRTRNMAGRRATDSNRPVSAVDAALEKYK